MSRLEWGQGSRLFDAGLDHGVLYLDNSAVPWNGLVSVSEIDTGQVNADYYFEGSRLALSQDTGDFQAVVSAYTYPEIFSEYNGYGPHDPYRRFGFSYRTQHGNGYKLHLVYNVMVRDDSRTWSTDKESVDPSLFTWNVNASAVDIPGARPASHLVVEVDDSEEYEIVTEALYGTETSNPRLPDPAELIELYESATLLRIVYNGDGTYSATGPDHMVRLLEDGKFELRAPSVFLLDQDIFVVNSYRGG